MVGITLRKVILVMKKPERACLSNVTYKISVEEKGFVKAWANMENMRESVSEMRLTR